MFLQDNLPAVITSPLSYNDPNPGTTRVNNISESGFDLSVQEWDYDDGVHNEEEISFFYAEPGAYNFGGLQAEIGFLDDVNHIFKSFEFNSAFTEPPVVITTQISDNDQMTTTRRVKNISTIGFQVKLQEQTGLNTSIAHSHERLAYIAIEKGVGEVNGKKVVVGTTGNTVNHNWSEAIFSESFERAPLVFADMQSYHSADVSTVRYDNLTSASVQFMVQEEQSKDSEMIHPLEEIGYIIVESDGGCDCEEGNINTNDTQVFEPKCNSSNGSISIAPEGNGPFTFEWSNGESTSILDALDSGIYTVTITDSDGCTKEEVFSLSNTFNLGLTDFVDHPDCTVDNGSIQLYPYGGVAPFTYQWNNGSVSSSLSGLGTGIFKVTVTDSEGCWVRRTFSMKHLNLGEYEVGNAVCDEDNGSISGYPHSGQPPFTYSWDNGETSQELTNLSPGVYKLTVTDVLGCTDDRTFVVGSENSISINASGGSEGFETGKFLPAGTVLNWSFTPYLVADELEIFSDVEGTLIKTGRVSDNSECQCNETITCDCADLYLGDYAGQTINLSTGIGDVSQALDICDFGLGDDIARVLSGEITINHDAYITVLVDGSVCGGYTSWNLNIDCSGNNSLNKLSEVELESFAQKEIQFNIDFDFNIYPNPASNEVVVQISDNHIPVDVSIKDITGKTTFIKNNIQVAEYRIDVQTMPQGIYFVHVKGRNQELVKKLMIE